MISIVKLLLTVCWMALALVAPAAAQNSLLIGVWSSTSYTSSGEVFASFWMQFNPNGTLQQRIITNAGTSDYVGNYQFDANQSLVQYQMNDYAPKMIPPTIQLGTVYQMPVQFANQNTMIVMDGGGPMEYHRQR